MLVLRCTQKLLVRLKQADNLADVESTTRLRDWYGNILQLGHRQHMLFISERSRLPVVIPIRDGMRLADVFPDAVCEVLSTVGVAATDIADERSRMSEIAFGRSPDVEEVTAPASTAQRHSRNVARRSVGGASIANAAPRAWTI